MKRLKSKIDVNSLFGGLSCKFLFMMFVMSFIVFSCTDDKGNGPDDPKNPAQYESAVPGSVTVAGKRLVGISTNTKYKWAESGTWGSANTLSIRFSYNDGKVTRIFNEHETHSIGYNPLTMTSSDPDITYSFSTTPDGFIKSIVQLESCDEHGSHIADINYSYNKAGYLSSCICKWDEVECKIEYTWNNGELINVIYNEADVEYTCVESATFKYDDNQNYAGHWFAGIEEMELIPMPFDGIALLGFMGKSPSRLPLSVTISSKEFESGSEQSYITEYTFTYLMNDDGTFNTERIYQKHTKNGLYQYEKERIIKYQYEDI